MDEIWYRFEDRLCAPPLDEFDNPIGGSILSVTLCKLRVVKRTPKGVWLEGYSGDRRFVLNSVRKRYACPTPEEALISFKARKVMQESIYRKRAENAREAAYKAELMLYPKATHIKETLYA